MRPLGSQATLLSKIIVSWTRRVDFKGFRRRVEAFLKMRLSPGQISQAQRCSPKQRPSDRRSVGRKPGAASAGRLEPCALAVVGSGSSPVRLLAKRCPASRRTEAFALPIGGIDAVWLKARAFDALQKRYFGHHCAGNPNIQEEFLDLSIINELSSYSAPVHFDSGWVMELETHCICGLHHYWRWEIADIGIMLFVREAGSAHVRKVVLLQSKRLYPKH